MTFEEAFMILERYTIYMQDCFSDSNYSDYDVDVQSTRNMLESIISKQPQIDAKDIHFLRDLLEEGDLGQSVDEAIHYILDMYEERSKI